MDDFDFVADLEFLSTEAGGRRTPAFSGYRPHIEFGNYSEYLTSGGQFYIDVERVMPGELVRANLRIWAKEYFAKRLYVGQQYKFCEGARTVGNGVIVNVLNKELEMEMNVDEKEVNLNLYPHDILSKLKINFGDNYYEAVRELQKFIISSSVFRNPRLIRAMIFGARNSIVELGVQIKYASIDWRDVLLWNEYDVKVDGSAPKQIRNFNRPFGDENL